MRDGNITKRPVTVTLRQVAKMHYILSGIFSLLLVVDMLFAIVRPYVGNPDPQSTQTLLAWGAAGALATCASMVFGIALFISWLVRRSGS